MSEITRLLDGAAQGDARASAELLPLLYKELKDLARRHMAGERADHTLQATALVHEAYLRLVGDGHIRWEGRGHFFAAAAEAMRRILIEHARRKGAVKRGGAHQRVELTDDVSIFSAALGATDDLLALNDAIDRLAHADPAKVELVKLLYFGGLNLEEAAAVLGLSRTTAHRQWVFARAWLHDAMTSGNGAE